MYEFGRLSNERVEIFIRTGKIEGDFYAILFKTKNEIVWVIHGIQTNCFSKYISGVLNDQVII